MREPLALVSADWHVRKYDRVWYRRDALRGDTAWGIRQIKRLANDHDVPAVILLGDLFEQKLQQSDALLTMRQALDSFEDQDRRVLFVQGQHERSDPPLLSSMHSWPEHIDGQLESMNDVLYYGLDYRNPAYVREALEEVPDNADVLFTHQVWRDFMGEDRGDAWFSWVPDTVKMIATGDFHSSLYETRGSRTILSPGPLCMQNIGESPEKFVYILYDDLSVEPCPLSTRNYYEERIHTEDDLESFLIGWRDNPACILKQGVPAELATSILRIHYRADLTDARQRIEACVGTTAHLFLSLIPVETEQVAVDVERRQQAVLRSGLEGCINEFYSETPCVHDDAVRLARVHTRDIQSEIQGILKERMTHGFDTQREGTLHTPPT